MKNKIYIINYLTGLVKKFKTRAKSVLERVGDKPDPTSFFLAILDTIRSVRPSHSSKRYVNCKSRNQRLNKYVSQVKCNQRLEKCYINSIIMLICDFCPIPFLLYLILCPSLPLSLSSTIITKI